RAFRKQARSYWRFGETTFSDCVGQDLTRQSQWTVGDVVERDRRGGPEQEAGLNMILEVAAYAGQVRDNGHAEFADVAGRTDAGAHQQLRRVDRTSSKNDLAPRTHAQALIAADVFDGIG